MRRVATTDAVLAALVLAVGLAVTGARGLTTAEVVVSVAMVAPLALRRVAPAPVLAVVLVLTAVSLVLSDRVIAGDPAPLIALYTLVATGGARRPARAGGLRMRAGDRPTRAGRWLTGAAGQPRRAVRRRTGAGGRGMGAGPRGVDVAALAVMALGAVPTGARWAGDGADAWTVAAAIGIALVHVVLAAALGELRRQALARAADRLRDAAAAERTRIARELHDVVAHALAVVVVQADAGRYAASTDPAAAAGALGTIGDTARAALTDMRAALGALREDAPQATAPAGRAADAHLAAGHAAGGHAADGPATDDRATDGHAADGHATGDRAADGRATGDGAADGHAVSSAAPGDGARAPQPSARDVETLVARLADAGLRVDYAVDGEPRPLGDAAGLTIYRIVQEALTNVVKHAGDGAAVTVRVRYDAAEVSVEIADDGADPSAGRGRSAPSGARVGGAPGARGGHGGGGSGLIGMRERVGVVGGEVEAGPDGAGWRVRARIPA